MKFPHYASLSLLALACHGEAAVVANTLFADHLILQRERPLPVWGTAQPGEKVTVTFAATTVATVAGSDGKWMVRLPPQVLSNVPGTLVISGSNTLTISDVLVGDVWLGCGQSNMDWVVKGSDEKDRLLAAPPGSFDGIRLFTVAPAQADAPQAAVQGAWTTSTSNEVQRFSATLFYFGEALHQRLPGVPLGLIRSSLGASNLYCWMPNEVRDRDPSTAYLREWWSHITGSWSQEKEDAGERARQEYASTVADLKSRGQPVPESLRKPGEVMGPHWSRRPSGCYNAMIAPLQPFAIRGMLWYQGEWDSKKDWVRVYHDEFVATANAWRSLWGPAAVEFPIYLVQLPPRIPGDGDYWPAMREVQERIAHTLPRSGFVTSIDTCDGKSLHPPEKSAIGKRLALLALATEYGQDLPYRGPTLATARPDGPALRLSFANPTDSGLRSSDGQPLRCFEIAGTDGAYVSAEATIDGDTIVVRSPAITEPRTVRYAFSPAPDRPNLVNAAGLPAAPFRTDSHPLP